MDTYESKARRAKLTLGTLGAFAAGMLVAGGITTITLLDDDKDSTRASPGTSASSTPTTGAPSPAKGEEARKELTPQKAAPFTLAVPTGQEDGLSTGFLNDGKGAWSAAVYFWEEYAFLDDSMARRQLKSVLSSGATQGYLNEWISEIRETRERANLAPSGPAPAGITFTTTVNAVRPISLGENGDVVQIWLNYDRHSTRADGTPNDNPLKGKEIDLVLKWEDGAWKLTNEPKYWNKRTFPASYDPDSTTAWSEGWRQVRHVD